MVCVLLQAVLCSGTAEVKLLLSVPRPSVPAYLPSPWWGFGLHPTLLIKAGPCGRADASHPAPNGSAHLCASQHLPSALAAPTVSSGASCTRPQQEMHNTKYPELEGAHKHQQV